MLFSQLKHGKKFSVKIEGKTKTFTKILCPIEFSPFNESIGYYPKAKKINAINEYGRFWSFPEDTEITE
jgi:hypothetical protein